MTVVLPVTWIAGGDRDVNGEPSMDTRVMWCESPAHGQGCWWRPLYLAVTALAKRLVCANCVGWAASL